MRRSRTGATACCLGILLLLAMAFAGSQAHAEAGAKWFVVNAKGELVEVKSGGLTPSIQLTSVEANERLLTKIAGISVEKKCTGYELRNAKLEGEGKISSNTKVRFTGCVVLLNGVVTPACEPHTGAEKGVLESKATKGLLVLHKLASGEKDAIVQVEPTEGETFMVVELGAECAIGNKVPIIGKITLKDCENHLTTEQAVHLVEEGPLTEVWVISKTAEHKIVFDGSALGELGGEHKGLKVSGMPG